ncbi:MAG TPA: hypothetical protein VG455_01380 [Acidimicrobiales bacterium]|nr:hypothetical protein [Acidimicrobiales bacterium]
MAHGTAHLAADVAHHHPGGRVQGVRLVGGDRRLLQELHMGQTVLKDGSGEVHARWARMGQVRSPEDRVTTSRRLRRPQSGPGVGDHGRGTFTWLAHGDSGAGPAGGEIPAGDRDRKVGGVEQSLGHPQGGLLGAVFQQDAVLVAAQSGQSVSGTEDGGQTSGHGDEDLVLGRPVDDTIATFESIEVEVDDGHRGPTTTPQGRLQPVVEGFVTEEPGEGVGEGPSEELVGRLAPVIGAQAGVRRVGAHLLALGPLELSLQVLGREDLRPDQLPSREPHLADGIAPSGDGVEEGFDRSGAARRHLQRVALVGMEEPAMRAAIQ